MYPVCCIYQIPLTQQTAWNSKAISSPRHNVNPDITSWYQCIVFFFFYFMPLFHMSKLYSCISSYRIILSTKILHLYNMILYQGMEKSLFHCWPTNLRTHQIFSHISDLGYLLIDEKWETSEWSPLLSSSPFAMEDAKMKSSCSGIIHSTSQARGQIW